MIPFLYVIEKPTKWSMKFMLWSLISRGSHIRVTCRSICDWIKNLDQWESSLITWSLCFEALDCLILWEFKVQKCCHACLVSEKLCWLDQLILVTQKLSWSLDQLLKRMLIIWFHFWPPLQTLLQATFDYLEYSVFGTWLQERAFNCSSLAGQFFSGRCGEKERKNTYGHYGQLSVPNTGIKDIQIWLVHSDQTWLLHLNHIRSIYWFIHNCGSTSKFKTPNFGTFQAITISKQWGPLTLFLV